MKNKKQKIEIEYNSLDIWAIDRYSKFIDKHLKLGNKIPARVLIKFGSFFTNPNLAIKKESENKIQEIKTLVYNKFSAQKEYSFNKKLTTSILFGNELKQSCSFKDMINKVFEAIEKRLPNIQQKDDFIKLVYTAIENYFSEFIGNTERLFSKYKRDAVIGFIIYKFGFHLSKEIREFGEEEPSNEALSHAIKYNTTKLQKKKSK